MGLVGEEKLLNCDMIRINLYEYFLQNEWKIRQMKIFD